MRPITTSLDVPCPACGARPVTCLWPSEHGAYCRCGSCAEMWHEDGVVATQFVQQDSPQRRATDHDENTAEVRRLRRRIARLEWENAMLRQSATSFADLAERLNTQLRTKPPTRNPPEGRKAS